MAANPRLTKKTVAPFLNPLILFSQVLMADISGNIGA